jgi:preprotein translocase subunit SecG
MTGWIIGLLTFVLILDCLFLILLVLVQLPKKEAGMGQAFGGGATDALFGAGSGNALTKLTKYATGIFFVLTLSLSILQAHQARGSKAAAERLEKGRQQATGDAGSTAAKPALPGATTLTSTAPATPSSGLLSATNVPAAPAPAQSTNVPVEK